MTTILETNLTIQGNRMNVITKKVTSWAAIIAVPTFVTGLYGMNVPYPGFGHAWASDRRFSSWRSWRSCSTSPSGAMTGSSRPLAACASG